MPRIKILRVTITVLFFLIILNLFYLQAIRGRFFYNLSTNNRIRLVPMEGKRGAIFDRNGFILAENRRAFNVLLIPQEIHDKEELFGFLSEILERDKKLIERRFRAKFLIPFTPVVISEDISREKAIVLEENRYRFPGLLVQLSFRRFYPQRRNNAHVLGYVGKVNRLKMERLKDYGYTAEDFVGFSGVEEYYDRYLKGGKGGLQIEVDSRGQQVRLLSLKEPQAGENITLTLDERVQEISTDLLRGHRGAIIVMDLKNGEILGLTSAPSFDPNIFVDERLNYKTTSVFASLAAPLLNRAISGLYPPGSVFKVPVAMAALGGGKMTPHTTFICRGEYELGGRTFGCSHTHGPQDLVKAIAHSCNVYFYHLGIILGPEIINRYAHLFRLGTRSNIDLPFEATGSIPGPKRWQITHGRRWYQGDTLNLSIGQGSVLTTPIQLVQMMSIIASEGEILWPHLIQSVGDRKVPHVKFKKKVTLNPDDLKAVRSGLKAVVEDYSGTAHVLDIQGLSTYGKTGTAQTSRGQEPHAMFVGYTFSQRRKIAFGVFLEHGGSSHNACVVARDLLLKMKASEIL